jgi:aspartate beta-hydroxylase
MPPSQPFSFESTDRTLDAARTHARNGHLADAESLYKKVLGEHPDQVEALRFTANAALSRGNASEAVALLSRAAQADRNDAGVLLDLALAYRVGRRLDEARSVLELALELSHGRNTTARLMLANILELDNRPDVALLNYFRAILDAQAAGQWLDDTTTEPGLRNTVRHAMQYVSTGRRSLFDGALAPLRKGINAARLGRIDTALAVYLLEQPRPTTSTDQRPSFLYVQGLGANRFIDSTSFAWLGEWATKVAALDVEAIACIDDAKQADTYVPAFSLEAMTATGSGNAAAAPPAAHWAVLYQRGALQDTIRRHAPRIFELLEAAPVVQIPDYAPDAVILALPEATHSPSNRGRTNAFCTVVVAFSGSSPLLVTVGQETRRLQAGETLVFDSSFGFSFSAAGDAQARALVFEIWNPNVSSVERDALAALAITATAFDRRLQDLA